MSNDKWILPTGRSVTEFYDRLEGNMKHDADYLFARVRKADAKVIELEEQLEELKARVRWAYYALEEQK